MASSESVNSDGLVASRENLKQNVLLATSGTIDVTKTVCNSKVDLSQIDETAPKRGFWRNIFNLSKSSEQKCSIDSKCSEKEINNSRMIGNSVQSLSKKSHQIDAEKCQIRANNLNNNIDDTGDCISELIGHIGLWQVVWVIFLIMFQVPSAFHIFSFMFQVSRTEFLWPSI